MRDNLEDEISMVGLNQRKTFTRMNMDNFPAQLPEKDSLYIVAENPFEDNRRKEQHMRIFGALELKIERAVAKEQRERNGRLNRRIGSMIKSTFKEIEEEAKEEAKEKHLEVLRQASAEMKTVLKRKITAEVINELGVMLGGNLYEKLLMEVTTQAEKLAQLLQQRWKRILTLNTAQQTQHESECCSEIF